MSLSVGGKWAEKTLGPPKQGDQWGLWVPREREPLSPGHSGAASQGGSGLRLREEFSKLAPSRAFHVRLSNETAPRLGVGHSSEAVPQVFIYSFWFRISHVINTFPFYISM